MPVAEKSRLSSGVFSENLDSTTQKGIFTLNTYRRIFLLLLCLTVFFTSEPVPAAHAESALTASEACVALIRELEGFSPKPYYDYGQHTVGYGTRCPEDKYFEYMAQGISRTEAENLLRAAVAEIQVAIRDRLVVPYGLRFSQHQLDALVSFSFNLGTNWMNYDSTLRSALLEGAGEDELIYAFSLYSTAGGNYSTGLVNRRLCEANLFLRGIYSKQPSDAYGYVFYDPNGGSLTYRVQGFLAENKAAPAADAVRREDVFLGWSTDITGGSRVTELTADLSGKTLFARWQSGEDTDSEDTPTVVVRVTGDVVNIRKGPGTGYGIARQVYCDDVLIVSHVSQLSGRSWGKVPDGWICLDYTNYAAVIQGSQAPAEPEDPGTQTPDPENRDRVWGTVQVQDLLRIRTGPGTAYDMVGYLSNGTRIQILELARVGSGVWGRISRGWVCMDYVTLEAPAPEDTPSGDSSGETQPSSGSGAPEMEGTVKADALRIRSGPGTQYPVVGFFYQLETVNVSEKMLIDSVYWGKTSRGWINMDYVQTGKAQEGSSSLKPGIEMTVTADCLRVRKEMGTDSRIAALLYRGDKVTVLETVTLEDTAWGRVSNGWICMDYVK